MPNALKNRPTLYVWNSFYFEAFQTLINSRQVHQGGFGYIPLSELLAWLDLYEPDADREEREHFITMIKALDGEYVTHMNSQMKDRIEAGRAKAHVPHKPTSVGRRKG